MGNKSTFLTKQPSVQAVMPVELAAENIQVANPPENQINRCNLSTSLEEMSLVAGSEASSTFHDAMNKTSNPALATKLQLDVINSTEMVRYPCGHAANTGAWFNLQFPVCGGSWSNPQENTKVTVKMTRMIIYEITSTKEPKSE